MTRYLLDTNILSDLVRHPTGRVYERIAEVGADNVTTSIFVASELRFGVAKRGSRRLEAKVDALLGALDVLPFDAPGDAIYGQLRQALEARGMPIGGTDLFIAAHALTLDLTVVSANEREFSRIDGLSCENWLV